jgi:Outer membrane protein beta-barrel domain
VVKSIGLFVLFLLPTALLGQSQQSAVGGDGTLWAGGSFSYFNPDFDCSSSNLVFNCKHELMGPTAFFDLNLMPKIGAEGEARWLNWGGRAGEVESTYLIGPRYRFYRHNRFSFWARGVAGGGWITTPNYPQAGSLKGSYFVFAPGATVAYRLAYHLDVRADYEYQFWPSFAGPPTYSSTGAIIYHNNGLTPNGVSVGVSYRFLGQ